MNWQRQRVSESLMWDREYLAIKTFRWGHYTYFFVQIRRLLLTVLRSVHSYFCANGPLYKIRKRSLMKFEY